MKICHTLCCIQGFYLISFCFYESKAVLRAQVFILFFLVLLTPLFSQEKPVITFDENDGLASDLVRMVTCDRQGVVWIGTDNGLSRYDGNRFVGYNKKDGLPGNRIWGLAAGEGDSLFVGCYTAGLALLHEGQVEKVWKFPDPHMRNTFRSLLYDKESRCLVVGTDYGLYLLRDSVFHSLKNYPYSPIGKKSSVVSLKRYKGRIFFTVHNIGHGVYELHPDSDSLENSRVTYLGPDANMYALTFYHDTIFSNHLNDWYAIPAGGGEPSLAGRADRRFLAWDMVTLPGGWILAGGFQISDYEAVARLYDVGEERFKKAPWMLQTSGVFHFCFDTLHRIVWTGTENGLKALVNTPFTYYNLNIGTIRDLAWVHGTLLILTPDGVYALKQGKTKMLHTRKSIERKVLQECKRYYNHLGEPTEKFVGNGVVNLRYFVRDGETVYVNTNLGSVQMPDMSRFLPFRNGHFITDSDTTGYFIRSYQPLRYYRDLGNILRDYEDFGEVKDISDIRRRGDVFFMISYFNGMYAVSGNRVWNLREGKGGVDNFLMSMDLDSRGNIWAVSPLGNLFMFGFTDSLFLVKRIDHSNSEIIGMNYKWIKFNNGYLYLASNKGLNIIPEEELWGEYVDTLWFYSRYNGYLDISTSDPVRADRGYLFVHTEDQLLRIGKPVGRKGLAELRIRDVMIDGKAGGICCLNGREFSPRVRNIGLVFYLQKYPTDKNVEYRYRLNDGKWTTTNMISLSYLKPGKYNISMEAKDLERDEVYRETISFLIKRPFWAEWWFIAGVLLLIMSGGYILLKKRYEHLHRREEEKNRMIRESAELQIKALQMQMSPHFIFNALNTIQGAVLTKSKEETLDFVGDLSLVIRENLENVSKDYIPLSREIAFLQRYAGVEQFRLGKKVYIDFIISVEDTERLMVPPMLIQPLIENSIKHGILPKKGGGEIVVKIDQEVERLVVTVQDNGVGRSKAKELARKRDHQSKGLELLKKRLEYLNQRNNSRVFRLEIEDLFDHGKPAGTVVRLYLQIIRRKNQEETF